MREEARISVHGPFRCALDDSTHSAQHVCGESAAHMRLAKDGEGSQLDHCLGLLVGSRRTAWRRVRPSSTAVLITGPYKHGSGVYYAQSSQVVQRAPGLFAP